jgi:hypothetical protein
VIGEKPREIVAEYCQCESEKVEGVDCQNDAKSKIKEVFKDLFGADRRKFIKDVFHALIESECNEQFMDDEKFIKMIKGLNEF